MYKKSCVWLLFLNTFKFYRKLILFTLLQSNQLNYEPWKALKTNMWQIIKNVHLVNNFMGNCLMYNLSSYFTRKFTGKEIINNTIFITLPLKETLKSKVLPLFCFLTPLEPPWGTRIIANLTRWTELDGIASKKIKITIFMNTA